MTNSIVAPPAYAAQRAAERRKAAALQKQREEDFTKLSFAGYVDVIEGLLASGVITATEAKASVAWAHEHRRKLEATATARAAQEAEAVEIEQIVGEWRQFQVAQPTALDTLTFAGAPQNLGIDNLTELLESAEGYDVQRDEYGEVAVALYEHELNYGDAHRSFWGDTLATPHHWYALRDHGSIVPPHIGLASRHAYAAGWLASIADFRGQEAIVIAVPGQPIDAIFWGAEKRSSSQVRGWCDRAHGGERFEALPRVRLTRGACVHLRPPNELPKASTFARTTPAAKLSTGLGALDALFRGKPGLPVTARVLIAGGPKNCKTLTALELAESALTQRWSVVWLACDEADDQIAIRRLQRRGLSEGAAQDLPEAALAALDAEGTFRLCSGLALEEAWEAAHASAAGAQLLVVIDSLQTVRSAASEGRGEREGLEALIGAIGECQRKWPALVAATSEVTGNGSPKGTGRIAYSFTTLLGVKKSGERLTITAANGRDHRDGAVALAVDLEGQRLLDTATAERAKAQRQLRAAIVGAVTELGDRATSQNAIAAQVEGVDSKRVHAEVKAMLDGAVLARDGKVIRLP